MLYNCIPIKETEKLENNQKLIEQFSVLLIFDYFHILILRQIKY